MGASTSTATVEDRDSTLLQLGSLSCRLPFGIIYTNQSILGAVANIIAQYCFTSGTVVLLILEKKYSGIDNWALLYNDSSVFAGCFFGVLTLGYAGDIFGRNPALYVATWILIVGTLCSSLFVWGSPGLTYTLLASFRIVIGIGIGGTWPSTAAAAFENDEGAGGVYEQRLRNMAWVFGFQQVGQLLPFVTGLFMLLVFHSDTDSVQFRLVYLAGALACLVTLHFLKEVGSKIQSELSRITSSRSAARSFLGGLCDSLSGSQTSEESSMMLVSSLNYVEMMRRVNKAKKGWELLGCSLSFFCAYFYNYGVTIFTVKFMQTIYGGNLDLVHQYLFYMYSVLATLPTAWLSVVLIGRLGTRNLQLLGFALSALMFGTCGLVFAFDFAASDGSLMVAVLFIRAVSRFGAPTTVFVLPAVTFDQEIRASTTGVAASMGFAGSIVSIYATLEVMDKSYGTWAVFVLYWGVATLGFVTTLVLIPEEKLTSAELEALALGSRAKYWATEAAQGLRASRSAETSPLIHEPEHDTNEEESTELLTST